MTNTKVTPFLFEGEITVRVLDREGDPWFMTTDICRALGIANASQAVQELDDDEKGICSTYTLGRNQEALIVSESGLFTLILRSRDAMRKGTLPHRFRRWVTGEVLPVMRRVRQISNPSDAVESVCVAPEALSLRMVEVVRQVFGVQAAGQVWFKRNLPIVPAMRVAPAQSELFVKWTPPDHSADAPPL